MADHKYEMTVNLNVINHLGINLYSNIPAVLAEVVANSWDADAKEVGIQISPDDGTIIIIDDGCGMSDEEINAKFLRVGYRRREEEQPITPIYKRPVMGRKGIGKLSLFSIADTIEVQSCKEGAVNGFTMSLPDIKSAIDDKTRSDKYYPPLIPPDKLVLTEDTNGTRIVLRDLRKHPNWAEMFLRRRLARRFSVIDPQYNFSVLVNDEPIAIDDRHYYQRLQYIWYYGKYGENSLGLCKNADRKEEREGLFEGWIGTVKESGQLKEEGESLNRIVVMVRGKLAQEDILESFGETGLYTKFIIGEIHADFLDEDNNEDIATTSRQSIIEDDPRFSELKRAIGKELKHIQSQWTRYRNEEGEKIALEIEPIQAWFSELGSDDKRRAKTVFGKINQITVNNHAQRSMLFKYGILAFEHLKAKQNLDALENITGETLVEFAKVFDQIDDLEATLYHQILTARIKVIQSLQEKVEDDAREKVIQQHLFDHLWLLDPSWERATATEYMEQRVATEFGTVTETLTEEERKARIDIKYRTTAGKHVIVELKRAGAQTDTDTLSSQIGRYRAALQKILREKNEQDPKIDVVCVVGRELKDWSDPNGKRDSDAILKVRGARVVLYQELIENAYKAYKDFLDKHKEVGRISRLLHDIDETLET